MEVATTNNHHHHNHHNPHLHSHHQLVHPAHRIPMAMARQQQPNLHLSVISATADATDAGGNGAIGDGSPRSPFQREVREWQRIDPDTGALLSGRLEADRWINGPLNSYGKISDSQNISQPNGTQHTQRKQLEVLQTRTANGAVKVIRAQTVQTSSSRSWSSSNSNSASTSASASASASPICMASNSVGGGGGVGRSILHNHNNHHHNHHNNNNSGMSNNNHFHSTLQQHLAEANTHWLQLSPPTIATTVDISEVSTDDDLEKAAAATASATTAMAETTTPYIVDDGETDDGAGAGAGDDGVPCNYSICRSGSGGSGGSSGGSKGQAISNAIVLPLSSSSSTSTLHSQSSSVRLLPDTAPSLKLSNLMKSSSGGSNSSSNNSTNTTNTTTANTHKSAVGKVSLHAIVGSGGGDNNNSNKSRQATSNVAIKSPKSTATATQSSNGTVTGTKTWQQQRSARHLEQATLYGQNSNSTKSRVGVADCDDCSAAGAEAEALTALPDDADESRRRYHHHHHHQQQQQQLRNLHQTNQQPQQQNQQIELLERATPTRRRDLESFRHYAGSAATAQLASETMSSSSMDDNAKDDDLRLTTRQLRRQQQPFGQSASSNNALLQRSHSISTDDLSNEWESHEAIAESNEWRRVSKLRRSFQSSSSGNNSSSTSIDQQAQSASSTPRRLFDLPASSVSVSRIRAELESGRRLTTAMRNNHVDLAALESILHGPKDATTTAPNSKHNALLTAESLKEIRGRLKKLSDESLYKDDFIAYQQPPEADEHIEVQQSVRRKLSTPRLPQLTPEESPEISTPPHLQQHQSAFRAVGTQRISPDSEPLAQRDSPTNPKHNSHSLESRQKVKDTNSTEWHSRRKSYGFEQMSPPENKSIFRMDASTDSGLGRSGELSNWSPTESAAAASTAAAAAARATVIHFGEPAKTVTQAHFRAGKSPARHTPDEDLHKRHSIAVDESQYVRDNLRKTSQVHLNGFYDTAELGSKPNMQLSRYDSNPEGSQGCNSTLFQRAQNAQKRVEFCKTEVHFAAESGRVNIVETDGKPPPTNNFRRRRRTTSGPLQSLTNSSASTAVTTTTAATASGNVTHFGDDRQRHRTIASSLVAYKATLMEPPDVVEAPVLLPATTGVTVSVQKLTACSDSYAEGTHASYASTTSGIDTTDNENDEIAGIRGILKNKPVKPKPYHLGENIDSADALWGVQLKPVAGGGGSSAISDGRDKDDSPTAVLNKSVAERVRIAEKRREHSTQNGYSTKINLSLDEAAATGTRDWPSTGTPKLTPITTDSIPNPNVTNRRPSAQELILQDLREHQRMLDEGLKSTSLIIKTMRSANEFDEAMRRLSIVSLESANIAPIVVPTPMLRSNSYQETKRRYSNTSLDSTERELTTHTVINTTATTTTSRRLSFESQSAFVTPLSLPPAPLVAPRLKLLGSAEVSVSQQLSQLRRMYDIAATQRQHDEDGIDSADEEVKSYFCAQEMEQSGDSGGGTLESSSQEDERGVEYSSGSWSRMKAKRTIWKIEAEERKGEPTVLDKADLPKSNIMSIELHSPHISLEKRDSFKRMQSPPRAKPRTTTSAVNSTEHRQIHIATTVKQPIDRCMPTEEQRAALKIIKEARGARKLREHELSYFGVANAHKGHEVHETKTKLLPSSNTNAMSASTRRTLPSRQRLSLSGNEVESKPMRRHEANNAETTTAAAATAAAAAIETTTETKATKWQLLNDKPDLLRHSPIAVEPQLIRRTADIQSRIRTSSAERGKRMSLQELSLEDEHVDEDDYDHDNNDHYYENITNELTPVFKVKSPQPYDRKMDVERDAFILSEMNENADLTMKALSDEAAHKDRRRRRSSLHRRDSKPLETIDEKMVTHKNNDTCIAVKISRGTFASEAKRNTRQSSPTVHDTHTRVRTSSQSSVESCPRARSRSLSSEREYENIRTPKPTRSATTTSTKTQAKVTGKQQHRSSSRESQRSARLQYSSGDEVNARDEQRVRVKSKRSGVSSANALSSRSGDRRSKKDSTIDHKQQQHHSSNSRDGERRRAASSTTHASQREERAECVTVPQQQQRTTSSGRSSSSKRREEHVTSSHAGVGVGHSSSRSATEKSRSVNAGVRLLRTLRRRTDADCGVHSTQHRLSGHRPNSERERSEREHERERVHEKERERDKQSKTRGHSTSKTPHHSKNSEPQRISGTTTHQLPALSSSMTRSKSRERKKSSVTKQHESAATPTHSKSSQIISGRHSSGQRDGQPNKQSDHSRRQHERSTSEQKKRSEHSASARK
ncbi:pneumococcal serine-rich repeat protein [Rhagoletis pomonella]|uniref:pneumococcal serine-rich repeat protein n=1 Tax=Rhagoletis pomonella TaxID=28610 RepID=UPI00177E7F93|nr:pneumococcal serine-rich repeat protein [Rhagoletis pomonella]